MGSIERNGSTPPVVSDMGPTFVLPPGGELVAFAPGGVKNKVDSAPLNNIVPFQRVPVGKGEWAVPAGEQPGGVWMVSPGAKLYLPPNATLTRRPEFRQAVRSFFEAAFQQNPNAVVGGIRLQDFRAYVALANKADTGGPDDWRKVEAFEKRLVQALESQPPSTRQSASRAAADPVPASRISPPASRTAPPASRTAPPASKPIVPPIPTVVPPETTISGPPPTRTEAPLPELPRIEGFGGTDPRTTAQVIAGVNAPIDAQRRLVDVQWGKVGDAANRPVPVNGSLDGLRKRIDAFGLDPSVITDSRFVAASNALTRLRGVQERIDSLSRATVNPNGEIYVDGALADPAKVRRDLAAAKEDLRKSLPALEATVAELEKTLGNRNGTPEPSGFTQTGGTGTGLYLPNHVAQARQGASGPIADAGGPGDIPPTKPPTGGGGNGDVPDPDEDPEGWNTFIDGFMAQMEKLLSQQGVKLSKGGLDKLREALTSSRRMTNYTTSEFMSRAEGLAAQIKGRHFNLGVDLNTWSTRAALGSIVGSGALAVASNANPDFFATVVKFMTGKNVHNPPKGSKDISHPGASVENGGSVRSLQNQINFVVGAAPEPSGDLADPKVYKQNREYLEKWMTNRIRAMVNAAVQNNDSQAVMSTTRDTAALVDEATKLLRLRLLGAPGIDTNLAQLGFVAAQQSYFTLTGGLILNTYTAALARMREMRADRIGQIVNTANKEVAQVREGLLPTLGGFRVETSGDPAADLVRIDRNISEAQEYEKRLLMSQEKIQKALEELQPYVNGLEGSDLEGAPVLKQSLAELQGTLSAVQSQTLTIGNMLLTLGNQKSSLNVALQNLGINERNEVRNQTSRDESAASNQRALGKSAMDRWNAASDHVARPIAGAPGFRLPFSGRGNLLERLDDAVKSFGMTANEVPASVWLQVLDKIEPNWIYAVLEPTSKPLTPAEVAQRKAEILGGAGRADPKLVNAVLETMTTNR